MLAAFRHKCHLRTRRGRLWGWWDERSLARVRASAQQLAADILTVID